MLDFANNGGRARWVTSPILDEADWEALQTGYTARGDPVLRRALKLTITNLARTLEKNTLSSTCLSQGPGAAEQHGDTCALTSPVVLSRSH
jgi:hypothetical protein